MINFIGDQVLVIRSIHLEQTQLYTKNLHTLSTTTLNVFLYLLWLERK